MTKKTKYSLKKDHAEIKKMIKKWEMALDCCVVELDGKMNGVQREDMGNRLENISHEMMSINM